MDTRLPNRHPPIWEPGRMTGVEDDQPWDCSPTTTPSPIPTPTPHHGPATRWAQPDSSSQASSSSSIQRPGVRGLSVGAAPIYPPPPPQAPAHRDPITAIYPSQSASVIEDRSLIQVPRQPVGALICPVWQPGP